MTRHFLLLALLTLTSALAPVWSPVAGQGGTLPGPNPAHRYTEAIPVYDAATLGWEPVVMTGTVPADPDQGGDSRAPENFVLPPVHKSGPTYQNPGATARYTITLANSESVTRTVHLSDPLPPQLAYVPGSSADLAYNPASHTLSWEGTLAPGYLDLLVEPAGGSLPYLDLAAFGAPNLCADFIGSGAGCDDVAVTFNLGVNGHTFTLYGQQLSQITVSSNGLALGAVPQAHDHPQWLPDGAPPSYLLAGLWFDADMTATGRWHAAIVTGLLAGHDVFYAQWHDTPAAADPDLTVRHAIAIVLDSSPLSGWAFFIYDNVSDPVALAGLGYTIGVEDKLGQRGATHAYAPCCGDPHPPQGQPPAAGTTLQLRPVLRGADNVYRRTFTYQATVQAPVPEMVVNTAFARSDSPDPALADAWSSHYLYVRHLTLLPTLLGAPEVGR